MTMPIKDKEAAKAYSRAYYLLNKAEIKRRSKEWATANPDRRKAISRASAKRNYQPGDAVAKEVASARASAWAKANAERVNTKNREWRAANPEKNKSIQKNWRLLNRDRCHELKQIRRAREAGAFVENVNRMVVYKNADGICGICGLPVPSDDFHVDHITPISRGGLHCYANTQPTHPSCNLKKSNTLDYSALTKSK